MEKKIIFLSSSSSFIGKELIKYYLKKDFKLIAFSNYNIPLKKKNFFIFNNLNKLKNHLKKIKKIDYLILNNGVIGDDFSFKDLIKSHYKNTVSFLNLFGNIKINRIIFFRSADESGYSKHPIKETDITNPFNKYSLIKSLTTHYILNYCIKRQIDYTFFKLFLVVGKKQKNPRLFPLLKEHINDKKKFLLNKPFHKKNFIHINDFITVLNKILNSKNSVNQTYNLVSNQNIYLNNLFFLIKKYKNNFTYELSKNFEKKNQIPDTTKLFKEIGNYKFKNIRFIIKDLL